jgi:hypothetical protein
MSKEVGGCFPRTMFAFVFLDFKGVGLAGTNLDAALFTPVPSALDVDHSPFVVTGAMMVGIETW